MELIQRYLMMVVFLFVRASTFLGIALAFISGGFLLKVYWVSTEWQLLGFFIVTLISVVGLILAHHASLALQCYFIKKIAHTGGSLDE